MFLPGKGLCITLKIEKYNTIAIPWRQVISFFYKEKTATEYKNTILTKTIENTAGYSLSRIEVLVNVKCGWPRYGRLIKAREKLIILVNQQKREV